MNPLRETASLQVTGVAVEGDPGHEQITHLQWEAASSVGIASAQALIGWLAEDPANEAWLADGDRRVAVEVVRPVGAPPYLRSRIGGQWGDHLLGLPRL